MMILALGALTLPAISGCSSMNSSIRSGEHIALKKFAPFEIRVRTPSESLSAIVYELAVQDLGRSLEIADGGPSNGVIEVMFSSHGDSAFFGSSSSSGIAQTSTSGWYTGNTLNASTASIVTATTVNSGTSFTWQNSTMIVVVRDKEGRRLYTADYDYKGGW